MARVKSTVSIDEMGLENKLKQLINDPHTMLQVHARFAQVIDPWVPYLHGPLSETVEIDYDCVRYIQPYARRQYYGLDFNHTKDIHPLASAMWDKAAMETQRERFAKEVHDILVRRARQLNG